MVDRHLIDAIRKGDERAFRILYESYFNKVINYAFKLVNSREDSREIAQDVFVRLWNKRYALDPDQSVSGLIFRITKFLAIDLLRKQHSHIETLSISAALDVGDRSLETTYLNEELHAVYQGIIEKLPQKRRLIFQLSRDENLSYKEIAQRLNISAKTVEAQIRLALQQIREDIRKYSDSLTILLILLFF